MMASIPALLATYHVPTFSTDANHLTITTIIGSKTYRVHHVPFMSGNSGKIFIACDTESNENVAIKQIRSDNSEKLENELNILQTINHPNIVKLVGGRISETERMMPDNKNYTFECLLVMELFPKGDLFELIKASDAGLHEVIVLKIACDIAAALAYLHDHEIVDGDIKPENILIDYENGIFKITDFGGAIQLRSKPKSDNYAMTYIYTAPESLLKEETSCFSDMWSLGILLYVALTRDHLLPLEPNKTRRREFRNFFAQNTHLPDMETHFSKEFKPCTFLYKTTKQLLSFDPTKRPSAHEIHQSTEQELAISLRH